MNFRIRDYQGRALDRTQEEFLTHRSTLIVLPTGTGKTICFAELIRRIQPKRAIVLAHREELIWQARNKIEATTGIKCGIEMADMRVMTEQGLNGFDEKYQVIVGTVQSMNAGFGDRKRMSRFNPHDFDLLVIDEFHHGTAKSYVDVMNYFKQNPNLKVLGVTATPTRADKEALSQVCESVAFEYSIMDAIEDGWLVPITQQFVTVSSLDYSHIRTTAGDLNGADLAKVMEAESNIVGVCQPSMEVLFAQAPHTLDTVPVPEWGDFLRKTGNKPRRAIMFTASVAQAESCCNIFNRVVPNMAAFISAKTPKEVRRDVLDKFSSGHFSVVMNCGVLTEGFDEPAVEVIFMARPTLSQSLFCQMIGRSTRPLPGIVDGEDRDTPDKRKAAIKASPKWICRIIDYVGNSGRHKLVTCADVLGGHISEEARGLMLKHMVKEGKPFMVSKALSEAEAKLREEKRKQAEARQREEAARKATLVARARYSQTEIDPFNNFDRKAGRPMPRGGAKLPVTEKQAKFLRRNGIDSDKMTRAQAGEIIGKLIEKFKKRA